MSALARAAAVWFAAVLALACSPSPAPVSLSAAPSSATPRAPVGPGASAAKGNEPGPPPTSTAAASPGEAPAPDTSISVPAARKLLFPRAEDARAPLDACGPISEEKASIRCMLRLRYAADPEAAAVAVRLYDATGDVAGLEPEGDFDGGWRGQIHFVPELPVGRHRRHLVDVAASLEDLERFMAEVRSRAPAPVRYRMRDLGFRFFRSVGRTTPSAFAEHWSVGYNVSGSLLGTAQGVAETLVHELFHLNDEPGPRAVEAWSHDALGSIFDAIVATCGTKAPCLAPYAPNDTMVRGGTYYAFQPGGGVHEYAAELAVRYVKETRAALAGVAATESRTRAGAGSLESRTRARLGSVATPAIAIPSQRGLPFRCGPAENARAWAAIVGAFFGGLDLSPACPDRP